MAPLPKTNFESVAYFWIGRKLIYRQFCNGKYILQQITNKDTLTNNHYLGDEELWLGYGLVMHICIKVFNRQVIVFGTKYSINYILYL